MILCVRKNLNFQIICSPSALIHFNHLNPPRFFRGIAHSFHPQIEFRQLLEACSNVTSLNATKSLHALVITMGSHSDQPIFVYNNIINQYASLSELSLARKVFNEMPERTVVSYNTIISGYSRCQNVQEVWKIFNEMRGYGFRPTQFTFGGLLSCETLELCEGIQLQGLILKNGLLSVDAFAGTALMGLFGRCGCLDEVIRVFDAMPVKNLVTWNSMLSLLGQYGYAQESMFLFRDLLSTELTISESSVVGVLVGFAWEEDLGSGTQIHCLAVKHGLDYRATVANALISMYVRCSGMKLGEKMFKDAPVRDVISWNTIIGALSKTDKAARALELFSEMYMNEAFPNQTTYVSIINSCATLQLLAHGQAIHAKVIRFSIQSHVYVGSALVDFYGKCGRAGDAQSCFDEIDEENVVSWNALISAYSTTSSPTSLSLLREMVQLGYCPNEFSFSAALKSSLVFELQQLHSFVIRMGYDKNEYVLGSLISSYARNNLINEALAFVSVLDSPLPVVACNIIAGIYNRRRQYHDTQDLFSLLEEPDMVSWNILIAACARNGDYQQAMDLLRHMQIERRLPDEYSFISLLSVCTKLCNLVLGSSIHGLIIKIGYCHCDTFVCNGLMDMYGKCGSIESSVKISNSMMRKNLITWTVLISVLGLNGYPAVALERFREMELDGYKPDGAAFTAVLSACRHGGLKEEGIELFRQMKAVYGIEPQMEHYHSAVCLLARHGQLNEAERLISSMPFPPNELIWRSFLEGSRDRGLQRY